MFRVGSRPSDLSSAYQIKIVPTSPPHLWAIEIDILATHELGLKFAVRIWTMMVYFLSVPISSYSYAWFSCYIFQVSSRVRSIWRVGRRCKVVLTAAESHYSWRLFVLGFCVKITWRYQRLRCFRKYSSIASRFPKHPWGRGGRRFYLGHSQGRRAFFCVVWVWNIGNFSLFVTFNPSKAVLYSVLKIECSAGVGMF